MTPALTRDKPKTSRIDLRLTAPQRDIVEQAAALSGSSLSGWAVTTLAGAAIREVAAARTTAVSEAAWSQFVSLLDNPTSPTTAELLSRTAVWDQA